MVHAGRMPALPGNGSVPPRNGQASASSEQRCVAARGGRVDADVAFQHVALEVPSGSVISGTMGPGRRASALAHRRQRVAIRAAGDRGDAVHGGE